MSSFGGFGGILCAVLSLRVVLVGLWLAGTFGACSRVEVVGAPKDVPLGEDGGIGNGHAGSGSAAGDGTLGEGGALVGHGGEPSAIDVALWPTYAASPGSGDARAVQAAVAALSAGSLTLPLHEKWSELSGATGSPRAVVWQRLEAMTKPYLDRGGKVALCIDVVDRTLPAWPFLGELDAERALPAIESTIDEAFERYGAQLSRLCFGYELDRYVAQASSGERQRLLELITHGVKHARRVALRLHLSTAVGVAVTLEALVSPERAAIDDFHQGDEVVAVYDPLTADAFSLKPPDALASELGAALATLAEADGKPLALFEVGYPSAMAAGSSEKGQRRHFTALLTALDSAREQLSFVGMYGLGDRALADCEAEAPAFGLPPGVAPDDEQAADALAARALSRCSMGLRAENGEPKQAWESALSALSRYSP